jgi:hypothetical protein
MPVLPSQNIRGYTKVRTGIPAYTSLEDYHYYMLYAVAVLKIDLVRIIVLLSI